MGSMITATDFFCGAGGSSTGLAAADVEVVMAANHWQLAVDTHNTNHPNTRHDCADISQVDPRRYPTTTIGWFSPSCTNHSIANRNARQQKERGPKHNELYPPLPKEAAERSRATAWDVVRMSEYHQYKVVVVENVVDFGKWVLFDAWLMAMRNLGYRHQIVWLNSMFAGVNAAPQSRDRMYVVFYKDRGRKPDLAIRPRAFCTSCQKAGLAIQSWKKPNFKWGRYKTQYVYRCPHCTAIVSPHVYPASDAIDWTIAGDRIGDKPIKNFYDDDGKLEWVGPYAEGTMRRIQKGIDTYWAPLLIPVEHNKDKGKKAYPAWEPLRTQTARATTGVALPFIAELRGGGSDARSVADPLCTVTASGNHHGLVTDPQGLLVPYYRTGVARPTGQPMGTLTTKDRMALLTGPLQINDCTFRMLEPHEIQAAMAFPADYELLGNKREKVRLLGNAVTPPASEIIIRRVVEMLTGEPASRDLDQVRVDRVEMVAA